MGGENPHHQRRRDAKGLSNDPSLYAPLLSVYDAHTSDLVIQSYAPYAVFMEVNDRIIKRVE
ncbi:hypothetical protein PTI98_002301 [Pleurotus ostreatus]|nr:hypothetical protein PTI98_002301 [Pleurotus ostreatus]